MGANFHTAYADGVTHFARAADMEAPLSTLDRALTYQKGAFIGCDGAVSWAAGTLTWTGTIHIYFNTAAGNAVHNSIAAGSIALADGEFCYTNLSETHNTALTVAKAAIPANAASNFVAYNRLLLGYRNAADDGFYPVALAGCMNQTRYYERKSVEAAANITASASVTITLNIPAGSRLLGVQFRVDTALATGNTWDAAYSGGSTTSLATGQAVAKNTKLQKLHVSEIASDITNIAITRNGGGDFSAQGTIRAIAYYETINEMVNA